MAKTSVCPWSDIEREAWKLPEQITVSNWADQNRTLDELTSAEPGQWRTDRAPYLRGIMDAFADPEIEEITIVASTQVGKTEALYNMMGFAIDQDPGPALYVMAKSEDVEQAAENRLKPMVLKSEALRSHMTTRADDLTKKRFHLDRMVLYFASSNSPSDLASRPVRYLFLDETDKYPDFAGREADPIKLAKERTATFWNRKIVKVSTPTTEDGFICREYKRSNQLKYYVPCPHCGKYQVLTDFRGRVRWPEEERDPERIKLFRLAWYECVYCSGKIVDRMKPAMLIRGVWAPDDADIDISGKLKSPFPKSSHYGFWLNALYSPWRSFSEVAAEFLNSNGKVNELMNWVNSWMAEPWNEVSAETKPETLIKLCQNYEGGTVPEGVVVLTAGVDVQKDHFYYVIRGWGYHEESWLIQAMRVESWEDIETVLFKTSYRSEGHGLLTVRQSCIDTGYRTSEVYDFCRKWRDIARPIKGQDHLSGMQYRVSHIDRHPRTGAVIPGGLSLYHLDTSYFKDKITRLVDIEPGALGGWHLYRNVPEIYLNQFCSEHKIPVRDKKKRVHEEWRPKSHATRRDFWDCEVYAIAAAEMIRVFALRPENQPVKEYRPPREQSEGFLNRKNGSWIRHGGSSWMNRGK